ncbi:MAG: hypothetical protein DMF84_21085 [Acidobacteria bacterium]|nr:MAG: hypothetical protein DMF84_21085 [Acidobacteriota bacterium]
MPAPLGATRGRIVWQLLLEAYAIVALGTAAGLLLAAWLTPTAATLAAHQLGGAIAGDVVLSWRVLIAIVGVSIVSATLCGLAPYLRTQSVRIDASRRGVTASRRQRLFRRGLIAGQVAIAFVLLVAVIVIGGSLRRILAVHRGFSADGVVAIAVSLPAAKYNTPARVTMFYRALQERVAGRLGTDAVTVADELPLTGDRGPALITAYTGGVTVDAAVRTVGPRYFALLRTAVRSGREFTSGDDPLAPPRVIVSRSLARALWPERDASGQRVRIGAAGAVADVIGVVEDVKLASIDRPDRPAVYFCAWQVPSNSAHVIARSPGTVADVLSVVRLEVAAMDPDLPVYGARWLTDVVARSPGVPARRLTTSAFGAFATLALVLAGIGLFGLFSHDVASRRRELALRVALGATPRVLRRAVFSQVGLMLALGLGAGVVMATLVAASLKSLLFGTRGTDPVTFLAAGGVVVLVALAAAAGPARRAAGSDPIVLLNAE